MSEKDIELSPRRTRFFIVCFAVNRWDVVHKFTRITPAVSSPKILDEPQLCKAA